MKVVVDNDNVVIDGVTITPKCLNNLRYFQDNDNEGIAECRKVLADAMGTTAIMIDYYSRTEDRERTRRTLTDLAYVRDYFIDLGKP